MPFPRLGGGRHGLECILDTPFHRGVRGRKAQDWRRKSRFRTGLSRQQGGSAEQRRSDEDSHQTSLEISLVFRNTCSRMQ